jgi:nucleoside-diphosphate-sugar epimerase
MKERVLVTGGSGFIGTNLVEALLKAGMPVLNLSPRAPRRASHREVHRPGDVSDTGTVLDAFERFDPTSVIHLAARTEASGRTGSNEYGINTLGAKAVLGALSVSTNVRTALFTSSMVVGWPGAAKSGAYAESKARMEEAVDNAAPMKCALCIVRPVSIWGPYFGTPFREFFEAIAKGRYWHPGPANTPRRYGYVGNTVHQLLRISGSDPGQIHRKLFFLGDYEPFTVRRWADLISSSFRVKPPRTLPSWAVSAAAKVGDLLQRGGIGAVPLTTRRLENLRTDTSVFPIDDTRAIAGSLPYTLEDGVEETVHWMSSTRDERTPL